MSSDQVAPPYRMSPYVAIASYTTEWPSRWDDKFVKTIKRKGIPKMLKELGKEKPRQDMIFWDDKNFYLEKFREMKSLYITNKKSYRKSIENNISSSDIYPYKGKLRPSFRKKGLISEIEWVMNELFCERKSKIELAKFYNNKLNTVINKYPHE